MNQLLFVGRLVRNPEIKEMEDGKKVSGITLAVPRTYKNMNGEYDTDFIDVNLWGGFADNVVEYCHKGDLLGIKGSLNSRSIEEDGKKRNVLEVRAEKVTYLSSKRPDRDNLEVEKQPEV